MKVVGASAKALAATLKVLAGGVGLALGLALPTGAARAQEAEAERERPAGLVADHPVFQPVRVPAAYRAAVRQGTRTPEGRPGPSYWQQRVDYTIRARLEPETATLSGSEIVRYTNRAPAELPGLILHLYQNVFAPGVERNRSVRLTGGMRLTRVVAQGRELEPLEESEGGRALEPGPGWSVQGTLARVILPEPIPSGGTAVLEIDWEYEVPDESAFRTGRIERDVFTVAQWYPQVAVVDDVYGFDATPYLGDGEFYLEYGSFDVSLTVPEGWLVAATGELQNGPSVLPSAMRERLAAALESDTVVRVGSAEELLHGPPAESQRTWQFRATDVRDFAFAASSRYVWDAVGAETGEGRVRVQTLYDPSLEHWQEAAAFSKHAIELFSETLFPYPYPHATAAYGPVGGMEYPMLVFIGRSAPGEPLYSVLAHEHAHQWFPMVVGSREAAYAWMDEGLTTFNEALARADFYGNDRARLRDQESYLMAARAEVEAPLMQHTDHVESGFGRSVAAYTKPATILHALRRAIGAERFDQAYRAYAEAWSYRHPYPWDFFAIIEAETGLDLDWFWVPWLFGTETLDQAIRDVRDEDGAVWITVATLGGAVMPVELAIEVEGKPAIGVTWPVEVWSGTREVTRRVEVSGGVARVEIDPERFFPDVDRENNVWPVGAKP